MFRSSIAAFRALPALLLLALAPVVARAATERVGDCILEAGPGAERALAPLARRAREILPRLEEDLGARFKGPFRMVLIPARPIGGHMNLMTLRLDAGAPPWAAGYMIPDRRIGAIRLALASSYPYGTPASVLAHEATHMLLYDAAADTLPLWFQEGVATYEGRKWTLSDLLIHATLVLTEDSPSLDELDEWFDSSEPNAREAYAASFSFVSWAVTRHGRGVLRDVLARTHTMPFQDAWAAATGASLASEEAAWRGKTKTRYRWIGIITASATFWILMSLLAAIAGVWKNIRARRMRERWPDEPDGEEGGAVEFVVEQPPADDDARGP